MSEQEKGETSASKRALDDEIANDEPPKKKQRMSQNGNKDNENEAKESEKAQDDVRTVSGYDRPTYFEIHASNPEAMIDFYTKVFQWKFTPMHMEDTKYWGIQTGPFKFDQNPEKALSTYGIGGGLCVREGDPPKGDNVNTFLLYVDVHSIDDSLKLIKQHGGSVTKEKQGVPGMGFFAQAKDIEGGHIGLWQNVKSPHA